MVGEMDLAAWVTSVVAGCCDSPDNNLQDPAHERAWAAPLIGFSSGADPLYGQYKEVVGPFHWTPAEAFALAYPDLAVQPQELTVISWVLPQTEQTRADNRAQDTFPAERWARARIFGEQFNQRLCRHVAETLSAAGYPAVAPMLLPQWRSTPSDRYVYASVWSERHAAYAAGLGTFGLCDGLITPAGKAMRLGSSIARIPTAPTPRPYTDHHAYCLFFSHGTCGKCMARCPVGAITAAGHDKLKCRAHLNLATAEYVRSHYGFDGYGCGLCQTGVPCEARIPRPQDG